MRNKILFLSIALLAGCGQDDNTVVTPGPAPINPIGRIEYFLVAGNFEGRALDVFRVNSTNGSLARASSTAVSSSLYSLARHPGQPFIYAGANNEVLGYRIDSNGNLTPLPGLPQASVPDGTVCLDSDGQFLYAPGESSIDGFRVDQTTGALSHLAGFPLLVPGMNDAVETAFAPDDRFLHISALGSKRLYSFSHNSQTGQLTLLGETPTAAGPQGIRYDPTGRFVYVSEDNGTLEGFTATANGGLTQLSGFPVTFAPSGSFTARFDYNNGALFIGDRTSRTLNAFTLGGQGQLTQIAGYPVGNGGGEVVSYPIPLTQFLYVGDRLGSRIAGFTVGTTNQVTPLPNSPFPTTGGTTELLPVEVNF